MKSKSGKSNKSSAGSESGPTGSSPEKKWRLWICAGLALITFLAYLPILSNDFVNYDDPDYVTANPHVTSGLNLQNIAWAFTTGFASNWHPLTWISHMVDCALFDQHGGAHHFVSLVLHIGNTVLLFLVLQGLTRAIWPSTVVAALFALHPCHVESVAWISERKDVLSAFFGLLSIWGYGRYAETFKVQSSRKAEPDEFRLQGPKSKVQSPKPKHSTECSEGFNVQGPNFNVSDRRTLRGRLWTLDFGLWTYYALSLLFFALGLMSKPMLVTWPFILLLLDYWPLKRFGSSAPEADESKVQTPKSKLQRPGSWRLIVEKVPFFLLCAASSVVTFVVQRKGGAVSTSISFLARVENAIVAYARYVLDFFWPHDLAVLYPHPGQWPVGEIWASVACVVFITAMVVLLARSRPYLFVGWLWFLGTLVPVIGLVQVGVQSMADRYTYLPYIGLFVMVAWTLYELISQTAPAAVQSPLVATQPMAAGLSGFVLIALFIAAFFSNQQARLWHDSEALFRHAAKVTKNNYLAYNNLGFYLSNRGNTEEAIENYEAALSIKPDYEDALNNLGYALANQKHYQQAIDCYQRALQFRPNHIEVHNNLGNALSDIGKIDEAIPHYEFVLKQKPDHADAHNNYGVVLAMKGQYEDAIHHFHEALRYKPGYASAHSNLGNTYAVQHKLDQAISEYEQSLKLNPNDPQAHNNLGNVLAEQGKPEAAAQEYRKALQLNAQNPEAHFNLAMVLLRQSRREEAARHFRQAVDLKPDYAEAANQLRAITNR